EEGKLDKDLVKDVTIDQPHCAFHPHALWLFPSYKDASSPKKQVKTGQKFVIKNSADFPHNTKGEGGIQNNIGSQNLPKNDHRDVELKPSNQPVTVQCDIHPWMNAYVWVFDHPYAAVTKVGKDEGDETYGTYEIKNVPTGVKVKINAWHEAA